MPRAASMRTSGPRRRWAALVVVVVMSASGSGGSTPAAASLASVGTRLPTKSWTADVPGWKQAWSPAFAADASHVYLLGVPPPGDAGGPNAVAVLPSDCPTPTCPPMWTDRPQGTWSINSIVTSPSTDQLLLAGDSSLSAFPASVCVDPCAADWQSAEGGGYSDPVIVGDKVIVMRRKARWRAVAYPLGCSGTCSPLWISDQLGKTLAIGPNSPTVWGDIAYVMVDNAIYGFDANCAAASGRCSPAFERQFPSDWMHAQTGGPVVVGDLIYTLQRQGYYHSRLSAFLPTCKNLPCEPLWRTEVAIGSGQPQVVDGSLVVSGRGRTGGRLVAFPTGCSAVDPACRLPLWNAQAPGHVLDVVAADATGIMSLSMETSPGVREWRVRRYEVDCRSDGGRCGPTSVVAFPKTSDSWFSDDYGGTLYVTGGTAVRAIRCDPACSIPWNATLDRPARAIIANGSGLFLDISGPIVPYSLNWIAALVAFT